MVPLSRFPAKVGDVPGFYGQPRTVVEMLIEVPDEFNSQSSTYICDGWGVPHAPSMLLPDNYHHKVISPYDPHNL